MERPKVHYEVLVQRRPGGAYVLDGACEGRAQAIEAAELLIEEGRAASVRVSKEVMAVSTGEFSGVVVFERGAPASARLRRRPAQQTRTESPCLTPQDLYGLHARETIGRVLEAWLARAVATPYELLHRPDLVERLEASPTDLLHAMQKVAVPEAQSSGRSVHEVLRGYQALAERAAASAGR